MLLLRWLGQWGEEEVRALVCVRLLQLLHQLLDAKLNQSSAS